MKELKFKTSQGTFVLLEAQDIRKDISATKAATK